MRRAALALLWLAACGDEVEDSSWWDVGDPIDPALDYGDQGDKDDDEDDVTVEEQTLGGELELDGSDATSGAVWFYWATPDDGVRCDVDYPLAAIEPMEPCDACAAAWELTLGAAVVAEDDGGCGELGFAEQEGALYRIGYGGDVAWKQGGTDWQGSGEAEVEGQSLFFTFDLLAGR